MKQRGGEGGAKQQRRESCCAFFSALLLEVLAWGLAVVAITTSFWLGAPGAAARCNFRRDARTHPGLTVLLAAPRQRPRRVRCRR